MNRILVYGDSNTWGSRAFIGRYKTADQWPIVLQDLLGSEYEVIQEGLCGRIAGDHDTVDVHRNGKTGFEIALRSACPVDAVVVALGTNDLKQKNNLNAETIFSDLMWYKKRTIEYAKEDKDMENKNPVVIYLGIANYKASDRFNPSPELKDDVNKLLTFSNEAFVRLEDLEHSKDGLHYSKNDHKIVARLVFGKLKELNI